MRTMSLAAPRVVARAIVDRPDADLVGCLQDAKKVFVEIGKRGDQVFSGTRNGSRVGVPTCRRYDAYDIDLIALAGHVIGQQVPIGPPPFGAVGNL